MNSNDYDKGGTALPENGEALLPPNLHHRLSDSPSNVFNLAEFLQSSPGDLAFHVSIVLFRLTRQARQILPGLRPKTEEPPPEPISESGIRR